MKENSEMQSSEVRPDCLPRVSIILPTLNSERTLAKCLASIRAQDYPQDKLEIVIADGGSSDATLEIARRFEVDKIVENKLLTGEAGKSAAMAVAEGELLALIDSDNLLPAPDWLTKMVAPFKEVEVFASDPLEYTWRDKDSPLTRYFAMLGMSDPMCLFTGNYDRLCLITGRWTDLPVSFEDRGDYLLLSLTDTTVPTIGANGCIIRRSALEGVDWQPYYFDIDVIQQIVEGQGGRFAKVRCGIVHLYANRLEEFARKQDRRIRDFLHFSGERKRNYPWHKYRMRSGVVLFCLYSVTLLPLLVQVARGWRRKKDAAWLYHVPVCWVTLFCYGRGVVARILGRGGGASRKGWKG